MAIIYKDIDLLTQKSSVAGTEKLPVSDTQYITTAQIAASVPVDASLSSSSTNAVQNKAVGTEFGKVVYLGDSDESVESIPDTIEGITMNGSPVAVTNGIADLGTVITAHQSLSGYATTEYVDSAVTDALGDIETLLNALL